MKGLGHKLDSGLSAIYQSWLEVQERGLTRAGYRHPDIRLGAQGAEVRLRYAGSLADLERLGFATTQTLPQPGNAFGNVRFEQLPRIAAHPGVLRLSYGTPSRPRLDRSIPFVHADAVQGWREATHDYGGFAGREVVIAVLDTGIDFGHDFLQQPRAGDGDDHQTRILRIWDLGLIPGSGESGPRTALLDGRSTYGVEYTEQQINDTLNGRGSVRVRHRDCAGHGTHVTSIAAGNGGKDRRYVGMAPLAHIIGVKVLNLEAPPMDADGIHVKGYERLFADAVDYVFNVVRLDLGDKRVVINYSAGDNQGPHDGLSQREEDLDAVLKSDPKRIFVAAAGNSGGAGDYAKMTIPTTGAAQARMPMQLFDMREASAMTDYDYCSVKETSKWPATCEIWYAAPPPSPIAGTLTIQGLAGAITIPEVGHDMQATRFAQGQMVKLVHSQDEAEVGGVRVLRNSIRLEMYPYRNNYHLREALCDFILTGAPGQVLYAWGSSGDIFFRPSSALAPGLERAGEIDIPAGTESVIAVANFEIPPEHPGPYYFPYTLSSHGPLTAYNPAAPARPLKPDIGAPGARIHAAKSRFSVMPGSCVTLPRHDADTSMGGTSMASPHVAGLVALMLEKNGTLTLAQVRAAFRVLPGVGTDPVAFGAGVIDAQATLAAVPAP